MSRENLYCGKRVDNGEWIYGGYAKCNNREYILPDIDLVGREWVFKNIEVISETVGQFTGLTDKNGEKIFEGDIVKYSDEECYYPEEYTEFIGEIVFEKGAFGIGCLKDLPIDLDYWCNNDNFVSLWEIYWNLNCCDHELPMLEVIGNIHDNPELLEVEE